MVLKFGEGSPSFFDAALEKKFTSTAGASRAMKLLRRLLDSQAHHFEPGGKLERLYPLWEAQDSFLYTPGKVTAGPSHVRDGMDRR